MVADGNHGPENLKRQAGQLPAQALNVKKDSRKAGKQESKKVLNAVGRGVDHLGLRRPATAKALPVYVQQPTYLRTDGAAGRCQLHRAKLP